MIPAAPYNTLSLFDFYFGCTVRTKQGAVAPATQCTVTVAGFAPKVNQEVAVASFNLTPPVNPVGQVPMLHAVLPNSFHQALGNVTMEMDSKLVAVLLDNLHYYVTK